MRVLLIQSFTPAEEPAIFPLGLAYLAAALSGHDLRIFDVNVVEEPLKALDEELASFLPEAIGISLRNIKVASVGKHLSCFQPHQELIRFVKKRTNDIPLIAGGTAFSLYASRIMQLIPEIDYGIIREGEASLPELLANGMAAEHIPGLCYRKDGQALFTGPREWSDFASIASPRRDLTDITKYLPLSGSIGVQTKRGCVMQCIHCSDTYLTGQTVRLRPPEKVVEEIGELVENYGVKEIMFADQIFNMPLEHAQAICQGLIDKKVFVKWQAWLSPGYITQEFLDLAQGAGCFKMIFSPDSASNEVLKRIKKGYSEKDLQISYKLLAGYDIMVGYDFMINGPGESLRSICKLFLFLIKAKFYLKKQFKLHGLFIVPMRIYPHSELRKASITEGIIKEEDDLMEPVFYNPSPLKYLSGFILSLLSGLWKLKKHAGSRPLKL